MPIIDDDFEGYSVGDQLPFGQWVGSGFQNIIVNSGPYPANSNAFKLSIGSAEFNNNYTSFYSSFSVMLAVFVDQGNNPLFIVSNGPNISGHTFEIGRIKVETDFTLSINVNNVTIGNSRDALCIPYTWNFIQVNFQYSDWDDSGTARMHISIHAAINGVEVINKSAFTQVAVAQFANATSEVNRFAFLTNSAIYDNITVDSLQPIVTFPHPGLPKAYVHQGVIEGVKIPDTAFIRAFQAITEGLKLPNSAKILVYQAIIELLVKKNIAVGLWKVREM